jgi:prolipoprotein diacylglyceryltransferase
MILLILALWAGLALAERRAERHGVTRANLSNLVFYALLAYVVGGRAAFVLGHLSAFSSSPLDVFSLSPSVFDTPGALAAGLIVGATYAYRQGLSPWPLLDALTPALAVLAVGLGLSNLAADAAFGQLTDVPWGIATGGQTRHPAQLYESIAALLVLVLIWFRRCGARPRATIQKLSARTAAARVFLGRLFLEAFRGDSAFLPGGIRVAQLIAWFALLLCVLAYELHARARPSA